MGDGEWTEMLWETHAFTKAIPLYGDGTNCKPNTERVTRNMGGRTWDGFFRTVLLDAEDGVNSAACLQVSLATLGFPQASRSSYSPFILPFSLSVSQISFPASTHHAPLPSRVSVLCSANIPAEKPPCDFISKTRKLLWASVTLWRSIATDIYPPLSVVLWASSGLL